MILTHSPLMMTVSLTQSLESQLPLQELSHFTLQQPSGKYFYLHFACDERETLEAA